MNVLERIAERVRVRVAEDRAREPLEALLRRGAERQPADFRAAFDRPGLNVIAEVKLASPSEGPIAPGADPVRVASDYLAHGAQAISVLTERDHFAGDPAYLGAIRARHPQARLLMKDFVVDEWQVARARADGADAVLLIVALLGESGLRRFLRTTRDAGLTALVEVHDAEEMRVAANEGASLIGVNNRDLKTLRVSLETSERLAPLAPSDATLISESGLSRRAELDRLRGAGYRGFLIGTTLLRTGCPGKSLAGLLADGVSG
jgi:indole-3-glycerol phosphate synthase